MAVELKIMVELWNDKGIGEFDLFYVRTKDSKESDFLITANQAPWCLFEVNTRDGSIAPHHFRHSQALENIPVVQLTHQNNILKKKDGLFYRLSASRFFS